MSDEVRSEEKVPVVKSRTQIPKLLVNQIKIEYLEGKGSIKELSVKYGVSAKGMSERCYREGWRVKNEEIVEKTIERVEKAEASRLERLRIHEEAMILRMQKRLNLVDNTYSQIGELVEPQDLKSLVGTESTIDQVIRRNLGAEDKIALSGTVEFNVTAILAKLSENPSAYQSLDVESEVIELKKSLEETKE